MSLELSNNDLSVYTSNGKILSGGFSINSLLINQGLPAMMTVNSNTQMQIGGNNKVSDLFENLAVPSLVLHLDKKKYTGNIIVNHTDEQLDNAELLIKLSNAVTRAKGTWKKYHDNDLRLPLRISRTIGGRWHKYALTEEGASGAGGGNKYGIIKEEKNS